jgi:hypothetical protein
MVGWPLSKSCHPERRENGGEVFAAEGPLPPTVVVGVGVLRLRECFAARDTHSAQNDGD